MKHLVFKNRISLTKSRTSNVVKLLRKHILDKILVACKQISEYFMNSWRMHQATKNIFLRTEWDQSMFIQGKTTTAYVRPIFRAEYFFHENSATSYKASKMSNFDILLKFLMVFKLQKKMLLNNVLGCNEFSFLFIKLLLHA